MLKQLISIILITLLSIIITTNISSATGQLYIRYNGIWEKGYYGNDRPYITLGLSENQVVGMVGHQQDNASCFDGFLKYSQLGATFYTWNLFVQDGSPRVISASAGVKAIEIYSSTIKTSLGVGVGDTCGEVWRLHGVNCTIDTLAGWGTGFYYKVNGCVIFFLVGGNPREDLTVSEILIY